MATLNTLLVNADSAGGPRNWASQAFGDIDEGIAGADGTAIGDNTNANATLDTSFLLSTVDADFGNMDTLLFQVRRRVIGAQTNTRSLLIRIVKESDGAVLAAADSGGTFQSVEAGITNTTFDNGTATGFTFVDTSATEADWNDGRVEIRLVIVKSMAGDANGVEVDTLELTGTYTEAAAHFDLVVQDSAHVHTVDNVELVQANVLSVSDAAHDHTADNVELVQANSLVVEDSAHAHAADNIELVQNYTLTVQDSVHEHSVDNVNLTQANQLVVQDSAHGHTVDNVNLTQANNLIVDDSSHSHTADNVVLQVGGSSIELVVQDSAHAHFADNIELVQSNTLLVNDSLHEHTVDNIELVQSNVLAVNNTFHIQSADNVVLVIDGYTEQENKLVLMNVILRKHKYVNKNRSAQSELFNKKHIVAVEASLLGPFKDNDEIKSKVLYDEGTLVEYHVSESIEEIL
jgi:hypothetical protein